MRLFKTTYRDSKGKKRTAAKWYVEFRDQNETIRRLPAFPSKAASGELGRNLTKLVAYYKATGGQTDPALTRWLNELPQAIRHKLITNGLLPRERVSVGKPLAEHLEDFKKALQAKGCSAKHVQLVTTRVQRIIDDCGFRFYADISSGKVMEYLDGLRADMDDKRGISAQTFNFYVQASSSSAGGWLRTGGLQSRQ